MVSPCGIDGRCRAGIGGYYSQNYAFVTVVCSPHGSAREREITVGEDDLAAACSSRYEPDYLWHQCKE
jgi:hypothetical protein